MGPELRTQMLFTDRYVGVVRRDHPLAGSPIDAYAYCRWGHVVAWREGLDLGGVDEQLAEVGLTRSIMTTVDGFSAALALAAGSDLVATVPERHTIALREGMLSFPLPIDTPEFAIAMVWHPRMDGDPAHRWLRGAVRDSCRST
jgi:DNA-binding transcriptional LysR family regulator